MMISGSIDDFALDRIGDERIFLRRLQRALDARFVAILHTNLRTQDDFA